MHYANSRLKNVWSFLPIYTDLRELEEIFFTFPRAELAIANLIAHG